MSAGFTSTTLLSRIGRLSSQSTATAIGSVVPKELPPQPVQESVKSLAEVVHLRKSYGTHLAVKDVSFKLQRGEVLGLLGPNGAGKSTTMMMLAGLLTPTSGDVLLDGRKFDGRNHELRRMLGVVPQEYAIYQELNAIDNLLFFGKLYGLRGKVLKDRCNEVLEQIGLVESAKRPSGDYSGGMKRRLNFGVALMHKPSILILDEPTVGVDPLSRRELWEIILRLVRDENLTVLLSTAYLDEAERCSHVVVLNQGKVLVQGTPGEVTKLANGRVFLVEPPEGQPARNLQAQCFDEPGIVDAVPEGGLVRV
ncbi:MAG: ABC transporter ATP-binding protein, partial [Schlesneria sp.]